MKKIALNVINCLNCHHLVNRVHIHINVTLEDCDSDCQICWVRGGVANLRWLGHCI